MTYLLLLLASAPVFAAPAADPPAEVGSAAPILARVVEAAGLADPKALSIRFTFRGTPYRLWLDGRRSIYQRTVVSPVGTRVDRLDGDVFSATLDGKTLSLSDRDRTGLRNGLNSVAYFALLPRPLQDEAVIATSLGRSTLAGRSWETVEVRFRAEGGGDDHEDVYRYWFDPETHRIGFLAYTFATGEGGVRLRKATHYHEVEGVVLIDWDNHGRAGQGLTIDQAVRDFEANELPLLSTIALEQVAIERGAVAP